MGTEVLLIRHAAPAVDPAEPPAAWGLSDRGHAQARRLAQVLGRAERHPRVALAGAEAKMIATLRPLAEVAGCEVVGDPALSESHSEGWFGDDEFHAVVRAFFERPDEGPAPGWESARSAAGRFVERLRVATLEQPQGQIVICSGGRVLTAALCALGVLAAKSQYAVWLALAMPDVCELAVDNGSTELARAFGEVLLA